MMRMTICILIIVFTTVNLQAQTNKNASFLVDQCRPLASLRGDDQSAIAKSAPGDFAKIAYCSGFLEALFYKLQQNHDLYSAMFPDLRLLKTDEAFAKRYVATVLLIGLDVCVPHALTPRIAAMIIEKHAREHPEELTNDMVSFANVAFASAYPAAIDGIRQCK
jgi:hypothetical protein